MIELAVTLWVVCLLIALIAGVVKGLVGFAMPMILISGLGTFLSPELALAGLILPTLATNLWQAIRGGVLAALQATREHWLYLVIVLVFIAFSAQLVRVLPDRVMFLVLGIPVTVFAMTQLAGWRLRITPETRRRAEILIASIAGFIGGIAGVWGPPTVAYLTALDTPKRAQVQIQGVVYGLGAVMLLLAHIRSGILNAETGMFSAILLLPALLGMAVGFRLQDRLDQDLFRRVTLIVLVVAGLNLIRRGLFA